MQAFFIAVCVCHVAFWFASRSGRVASIFHLSHVQLLLFDGLAINGFFVVILKARALHGQRKAQQSFLDLMRVRKKFEMELELKKQAELEAQTDFLTGLFNRRRFVESAESELDRAMRFQRPLSLLMFDIDHFKSINDTWGHAMGDVVLQQVAHLIHDALRNADILGRTGGEEFAAVLVETEGNAAANVAQRLCATVADAVISPPGAGRIPVTVSIGLTQLRGRSISFDELLNEADQAMYAAKQAGRNRVSVGNIGVDLKTAVRSNPLDPEAGKEQETGQQTGSQTRPRAAAL
jgi:diguanylate cyclase (GGDEF)-like protein